MIHFDVLSVNVEILKCLRSLKNRIEKIRLKYRNSSGFTFTSLIPQLPDMFF